MNRLLVCLCFLYFVSCEKSATEDDSPVALKTILGNWQQVSYQYSIGGPLLSEDVKDGDLLSLNENRTFSITNLQSNSTVTGVFKFKNDTLTRIFNADADNINYISKTAIEDNLLTLIPIGPQICIEGCSTKYKKIE